MTPFPLTPAEIRNPVGPGSENQSAFPVGEPPSENDVLIVGGGPTGLALALDLALRGVRATLLEPEPVIATDHVRARQFTRRVTEAFRRWGVLDELVGKWTVPPEWSAPPRVLTSIAGHSLTPESSAPSVPSDGGPFLSAERGLGRPQYVVRSALLNEAVRQGVRALGGWRGVGVVENDRTGVRIEVEEVATGRTRTIGSRFVVAADGSSSVIRRSAGITRAGIDARYKAYNLAIRAPDIFGLLGVEPTALNIVYNEGTFGLFCPFDESRWGHPSPFYPVDAEVTDAELLSLARAGFGGDSTVELESATPYLIGTRVAQQFRAENVFVVGDAAHVRPPGGNLGEGIGDVVNLGWKIAAVLHGWAGDRLLDSYDAERRPHNLRVAEFAYERSHRENALGKAIQERGVPADGERSTSAATRRSEITREIDSARKGPTLGVEFDERYDRSPVVLGNIDTNPWDPYRYEPSGVPGHRSPDIALDPGAGTTLFGRLGAWFTLLELSESPREVSILVLAAERRGIPLTVVHLNDLPARLLYGAGLVLIRPDQHIAWRGDEFPEDPDLLFDVVLGLNQPDGAPEPVVNSGIPG